MNSLGQELKAEREKRGVTLEEISRATRISLRFLVALEADNLQFLPGGFFTKSIIRAYAQYLGLNEKDVLSRYEVFLSGEKGLLPHPQPASFAPRRPWAKVITAVVILAFSLAISYFIFRPSVEKAANVTRSLTVQAPLPSSLPVKEETVEEKTPEPVKELRLRIQFRERTWIQVYADGVLVLDGIKLPGAAFEAVAKQEFLLHLGNAGGIAYTLNGLPGKAFGRSGAVVKNIRITLENFEDFVDRPTEKSSSSLGQPGKPFFS